MLWLFCKDYWGPMGLAAHGQVDGSGDDITAIAHHVNHISKCVVVDGTFDAECLLLEDFRRQLSSKTQEARDDALQRIIDQRYWHSKLGAPCSFFDMQSIQNDGAISEHIKNLVDDCQDLLLFR